MAAKGISIYEAISRMRAMNAAGKTFRFRFRTYDRQRRQGGDLVTVNEARLRPSARDEQVSNSRYKLYFTDMETGRPLVCWQMLIVEFEGMPTILEGRPS